MTRIATFFSESTTAIMGELNALLLVLVIFPLACSPIADPPVPIGNEYMPLSISNVWMYEVKMTEYTPFDIVESSYYLKDSIITINDGVALEAELKRYFRQNETDEWEYIESWKITENKTDLTFTEKDIPSVHLVFPPTVNKKFDSNVYSSMPSNFVEIRNADKDYETVTNKVYNNTVTLVRMDTDDRIVQLTQDIEVFAKDIGMVEKTEIDYIYCQSQSCLGREEVDQGFDRITSLIEYSVK